jgi:hypothetical protein
MNAVYARYFVAAPQPARATVQVAALPLGSLVEIDAVALLGLEAEDERRRRSARRARAKRASAGSARSR